MFCIFAFSVGGEPHALINRSGPWPWKGSFHQLWLAYTSRYKWPAPKLAPAANDVNNMVAANKRQNTRHGYMKNGQIQLNFGSFLFRRLKIFKISTMLTVSGTLLFKNFLWELTLYVWDAWLSKRWSQIMICRKSFHTKSESTQNWHKSGVNTLSTYSM